MVGGGQLGLMLAEAGAGLGIECVTLDPTPGAPASRAARQIVADYDDEAALAELAGASDVATYEFENVPVSAARFLAERVELFPPPTSLEFAQDRVLEKTLSPRSGWKLRRGPRSPRRRSSVKRWIRSASRAS